VDDLNFLKRGGRLSGSAAMAGLHHASQADFKGDEEGRIVLDKKLFGRKKALSMLAELFEDSTARRRGQPLGRHFAHITPAAKDDAKALARNS
jgi:fatty acid-binding protein DegV